jgi:hypothetical protein
VTPRRLVALQERVVTSIKAAHPGTTFVQVAAVAGVDKSKVTRWQSEADPSEMKLSEVVALVAEFGAPAVLGPIAAEDGCDVAPRASRPAAGDPRLVALDVSVGAATLTREVHAALADGRLTDEEAEALGLRIDQLVAELHRLRARARAS